MEIRITNIKDKSIGARVLNADHLSIGVLNRIVRFWESNGKYDVDVVKV